MKPSATNFFVVMSHSRVTFASPPPRDIETRQRSNFGYTHTTEFINKFSGGTTNNYIDWNAGLIVGVHKNLSFDLRYVDTDIGSTFGSTSDARFFGGATFSF